MQNYTAEQLSELLTQGALRDVSAETATNGWDGKVLISTAVWNRYIVPSRICEQKGEATAERFAHLCEQLQRALSLNMQDAPLVFFQIAVLMDPNMAKARVALKCHRVGDALVVVLKDEA
ncbi:hypothetical protein [Chrysiogenes arsenatis]|uniref:hypothetical protein n=1 Tax=Chrysiogenes arsenatis TaxID=309797 RepID=UPI0003FC37AE|nr:hypothetical protein [Chrysiogenes arsenatis]